MTITAATRVPAAAAAAPLRSSKSTTRQSEPATPASAKVTLASDIAYLGDGTPVTILSRTAGGPDFPIVGAYLAPWLSREIGTIVCQWNAEGEMQPVSRRALARGARCPEALRLRKLKPASDVAPYGEAPFFTKTEGGHPVTIVSRTMGDPEFPIIGVLTYPDGWTEVTTWGLEGRCCGASRERAFRLIPKAF